MRVSLIRTLYVAAGLVAGIAKPATALDEVKDEKDRLKACEAQICRLVTRRSPATGVIACPLTKTWARDRIKEGSSTGKMSWAFGDARCSVDLRLHNGSVVEALKGGDVVLKFTEHTVDCVIEKDADATPIKITASPKIRFKDGKADRVWVGLKEFHGPSSMKAMAFTAAKLEDSIGLFNKPIVKNLNYLIAEKCPKVVSGK